MEKEYLFIQDAIRIAYRWVLPKEQKEDFTLVFLHEAIGSIGQWRGFPQLVCDQLGAKGLVYERQGYGDSSPLTRKRTKNYLEEYALWEMPQVIRQLLPNQSLVLVGHSDGGTIALLYASKFPSKVQAVIALAPHVLVEEKTRLGFKPILRLFQAGKFDGLKKYHGNKYTDVFRAWYDTWNAEDYQSWNVEDRIVQSIPTLIIQGEEDEYATDRHPMIIKEKLNDATVSFMKDCRHQSHLEKPQETLEVIVRWMKDKQFISLNSD